MSNRINLSRAGQLHDQKAWLLRGLFHTRRHAGVALVTLGAQAGEDGRVVRV